MQTEIYVVYVTYFSTVERLFSFKSETAATTKRLELLKEWVNDDDIDKYISEGNQYPTTIDDYDDFFLTIESDSYVGINRVVLN